MILSSIQLNNFRIHKALSLSFSEKLNYIIGGNGQGKTTILESIYYLCTTKSSTAKSDSEVVKFGEDGFEIKGQLTGLTENSVRVYYSSAENRKYYIKDGKQVSRAADVIGKFPVVILTPEDHAITNGSPADRRKFIDSVISQSGDSYLDTLLDYNRILRQRSSLLSRYKETRDRSLLNELDAWTENLVNRGSEIIIKRISFLKDFINYIRESYGVLLNNDEIPSVHYSYLDEYNGMDISARFKELLLQRKEEELRRATNLVGPHRDDFIFGINDINLRTFGSQGQHKTFQIVIRFAEFFFLKERTGNTPVFLLDDVFGELDRRRSEKVSEYLRSVGQAFITLTDFSNLSYIEKHESDRHIHLNNGMVNYA